MNTLRHRPHTQSGMVLLMALVMLLLVTLLGVTSVRMLTVEERMAANSFDRNLAFQAAETALREGEALAASNTAPPPTAMDCGQLNNGACVNGLCSPPVAACNSARWDDASFNGWRNATTLVSPLAAGAPQFFVEHLGPGFVCDPQEQPPNTVCNGYRITARSQPADGRAVVILQSIYIALMLTMARDHTLFYEAYNDASDDNGDDNGDGRRDDNGDDNGDDRRDDNFTNDVRVQRSAVPGRISWREIIR
ncbi:MAG: PilX N-terminal domain-containing pilus assembly protein [Pseudomonadota bacterium]|jgi:type IV pilus assembly protein PilX|nr:MAG: hypothetical protein B7Y96_06765 [Comamonadaceae bacterium 32-67-11]